MAVKTLLAKLVRTFWMIVTLVVIFAAAYESLGRVMLPRLPQYQLQLESYLGKRLGGRVEVKSMSGSWDKFQPIVILREVEFQGDTAEDSISAGSLHLQVDIFRSLLNWTPTFDTLIIEKAKFQAIGDENGYWTIGGFSTRGVKNRPKDTSAKHPLSLLLNQQKIIVRNSAIQLSTSDRTLEMSIAAWQFNCRKRLCSSEGQIGFESEELAKLNFSLNFSRFNEIEDLQLDAYLELEPLRLEHWVPLFNLDMPIDLNFERFQLGGKVWLTLEQGRTTDIRGSVYAPELKLSPRGEDIDPVKFIASDFVWQRYREEQAPKSETEREIWSLWLNDFTFKWKDESFEPAQQRWSLSKTNNGRRIGVVADALDLQFTNNTLLAVEQLPVNIRKILGALRPHGRLVNAHVTYTLGESETDRSVPDVRLEANLYKVGVSAWRDVPAAKGINGYIEVTPNGGLVEFTSDDLSIHFPKLYTEAIQFEQADGLINWANKGQAVWLDSGTINLVAPFATLEGIFSVASPRDGSEPRLEMLLSLQDADFPAAVSLVPAKRVDKDLYAWLKGGLIAGQATRGRFLYSGSIRKKDPAKRNSMKFWLEVKDIGLIYHPEWPTLTDFDALVEVSQNSANIQGATGKLLQLDLEEINAHWRRVGAENSINITSHLQGPTADGLRLLTDTPVREALFDIVDDFLVTGSIAADLNLNIPIARQDATQIEFSLTTQDTLLEIPSLGLTFAQISGLFDYQSQQGINSSDASATLFGEPLELRVTTDLVTTDTSDAGDGILEPKQRTQVQMNGRIDASSLYAWEPLPLFTRMTGDTEFVAKLIVAPDEPGLLTITSDLKGVEVNVPEPFAKESLQSTPFTYQIELEEQQIHRLGYGETLQTALLYDEDTFTRGEIRLGAEKANFEEIPGIHVRGTVSEMRVFDWWDFLADLENLILPEDKEESRVTLEQKSDGSELDATRSRPDAAPTEDGGERDESEVSLVSRLKEIEITVEEFIIGDEVFDNLIIQMEQIERDWWAQLENESVKGQVRFFADNTKPAIVELDYLFLPEDEETGVDALVEVVPQDLPAFDFSTQQFRVGKDDFGKWVFSYRPEEEGARLDNLLADVRGIQLSGDLKWTFQEDKHVTSFVGSGHSDDLGAIATHWGYPDAIEGDFLDLRGSLSWQGSPAWIAPERLSGNMRINAKEGRFADLESAPAALKLFGLFNLSSIARRVKLDFSDVFKKGYTFDSIEGELLFTAGEVATGDSLIFNGPSAKFKLDGKTDLINEELDQNLVVVLPLSDNIPIAATVLGVPQVGIPLWLLNKAFGNMFEGFTSVEYKVTGPIAEPTIETVTRYEKRISESKLTENTAPASGTENAGVATSEVAESP